MTEKQIDKLREKYPISSEEICIYSSFEQVLGRNSEAYTEDERKKRWNKIMSLNKRMKSYWSDISECNGCLHLNESEAWCDLQGLPCTYNPILTPTTSYQGMACCGMGYVEKEPKLFD